MRTEVTAPLTIRLLGHPGVEREGEALAGPRGFKAWGLLAYVLCADRAPTRDELVSQLFADAEDPLGALRWNLSALRRALPGAELGGDPVRLDAAAGTIVDVDLVTSGTWTEALAVPGLERELLEGMRFGSSPAFELWLLAQRRHLAAVAEAVLREAALARLARGDARAAAELAGRLTRINPLDESFQELYVRCLAATGDGVGAARQVARVKALFNRELGLDPSPALYAASRAAESSPTSAPVGGRAAAAAQLEAGEAAIAAGAMEAGMQCLRRAVADARAAAAPELQARSLLALGTALVHAARGRDEEASAALHEALGLAGHAGLRQVAAAASRELGYVEFLRARYERAQSWLQAAADLAGDDEAELGRIGSVLGCVLSDTARFAEALIVLEESLAHSRAAGDARRVSYTLSMAGRVHLRRGDLDAAAAALDLSLEGARAEGWVAFAPWPEALRGEVDLQRGDVAAASGRLEHAFALGCQVGDPCWEGLAARGLGLVAAAQGDANRALEWLEDARRRCSRLPDAYLWVEALTMESLCEVAIAQGLPSARARVEELESVAARGGMRDLLAMAALHRSRLGDGSALTTARMLAAGIDSATLAARLGAAHA